MFAIKPTTLTLAVLFALAVGFSTGFYTKGKFVKADQVDAVTEARHETAVDIQGSLKNSIAVEQKVAASAQQVETIRVAVARRIQPKETPNVANGLTDPNQHPACTWRLDVGTVRLLDSARTGAALDPAGIGDDESKAPSDVGEAEFIDNDLQVVEQYRDLAERHNALVDYVESLVQKQANQ